MPQFSVDQSVKAHTTYNTAGITAGNTYTVIAISGTARSLRVENDRGVKRWISDSYFTPIPAVAPTLAGKRWMISLIENGVLKPAKEPKQYASEKQAHAVAKDMAEKHRGNVFVVFEATGFTFVPTSQETTVHAL